MGTPVIELDGVSKRYRLGEHHGSGTDLRETIARMAGRLRGRPRAAPREFWSLRDISFTVGEGEAIGIIGANGAGKSTLLKIVSNITTPTKGRCRTRGRIGSLLEVGTGFHGELTGLENTYLNGAILGMTRRDVTRRLDEIIEFAGLAEFIDTPVKRYSSGMYLRLGFSIAAHLEADILVVDEVLAVGDAEFQRRCLGKMSEVEQSGRTVLFVSHNMDAMARLCPNVIWLDKGSMRASGPAVDVIAEYTRTSAGPASMFSFELDPSAAAQITAVALVDAHGQPQAVLNTWSEAWIQIDVVVNDPVPGLDASGIVRTKGGVGLLHEGLSDSGQAGLFARGRHRWRCPVPPHFTPGEYVVGVWLGTAFETLQFDDNVLTFSIDGDDGGRPERLLRFGNCWDLERLDADSGDDD
ncbi:MAG: ABC transporter ATP-binding protein [Acidimicrobiales bacterium]